MMDVGLFKDICDGMKQGVSHYRHLEGKHRTVWPTEVSAKGEFRRLLIHGEVGLRQCFARVLTVAHRIEILDS